MTEIAGKTAVVTGGAKGIGRASALSLARRGARLVLVDIDDALEQTAAEIVATGGEAIAIRMNVGREDAFDIIRERTFAAFDGVDIVMNNVGVLTSGLMQDIPMEEWMRVMNLNVVAVARSIRCFLPDLLAQASGHIVNTASFAGLYPYAYDRIVYAASKGAVVTMTESLALYLLPRGIGVTLLCPGPVSTGIGATRSIFTDGLSLRGPGSQFGFKDPVEVGEMVADAIATNRFFLPTDDQVNALLAERGADLEAFVHKQAEAANN
jgi:NAD(P)-dependent dehydrogenase (short-subunit alcohol dehydrogenase family)